MKEDQGTKQGKRLHCPICGELLDPVPGCGGAIFWQCDECYCIPIFEKEKDSLIDFVFNQNRRKESALIQNLISNGYHKNFGDVKYSD